MKVLKKEAETKEIVKLFRYTKELERNRDNVKILLENQDTLDDNQNNIKKNIDEKDKELKKLTRYKKIGKITTFIGGGLALSSSITGGILKSVGYSEVGDLLPLIGSGVGGLMSLTGSGIELYISEKEKSNQDNKKELEIERIKKIEEKHYRDLNRLKDNWGKLDDVLDRLFWLSKTTKFSKEVDEVISVFLSKTDFKRFIEGKIKHELKDKKIQEMVIKKEEEQLEEELYYSDIYMTIDVPTSLVKKRPMPVSSKKKMKKIEEERKKIAKKEEEERKKEKEKVVEKLEKIKESKKRITEEIEEVERVRGDKNTFRVFGSFWEENDITDVINELVTEVKRYRREIFKDEERIEITSDDIAKIHTLDKIVEETKESDQQSDELEIQIEQLPK